MVERLCRQHGTPLLAAAGDGSVPPAGATPAKLALHAFPTLEQLSAATEEELRADGYGYRAKYITGSVAQLLAKPEGGAAWLLGLRSVPYEGEQLCATHPPPARQIGRTRPPAACCSLTLPVGCVPACAEAVEELCTLPGIGPKVAACIALFSLDKHEAIPGAAAAPCSSSLPGMGGVETLVSHRGLRKSSNHGSRHRVLVLKVQETGRVQQTTG